MPLGFGGTEYPLSIPLVQEPGTLWEVWVSYVLQTAPWWGKNPPRGRGLLQGEHSADAVLQEVG